MRKLSDIALDIAASGDKIPATAQPYLDAMATLETISDPYYADSGSSVVAYFLANAGQWKGDTARSIKKELNAILKTFYAKKG